MNRQDILARFTEMQTHRPSLSTSYANRKAVVGRFHIHFLVERPANGGVFDKVFEFDPPSGTDDFFATPHGWDLFFVDETTGQAVETPLHGIIVTGEGWFDRNTGKCKVQIRAAFLNAQNNKFWLGQVGVDGLFLATI